MSVDYSHLHLFVGRHSSWSIELLRVRVSVKAPERFKRAWPSGAKEILGGLSRRGPTPPMSTIGTGKMYSLVRSIFTGESYGVQLVA